MVDSALVRRRLVAQGLATRPFSSPHNAVAAFGAMQGQDLPGVMASIALRLSEPGGRFGLDDVVAAFDDGSVVRGYPMRGTVFAVAAEDVRWMTELCAGPAVKAQVRRRAQLELDDEQIARAQEILLTQCTASPRGLSRGDLFAHWEAAGLAPAGGRGYHMLSYLIATGVAVYGPWNGSDNSVVSAQAWLPAGSSLGERFNGDETAAIAELLRRYLTSHGPATLRDFAWWTKLPITKIRRAFATIADEFVGDDSDEGRYWRQTLDDEVDAAGDAADGLFLLPGFDEIVLGYPDRLALLEEAHHPRLVPGNNGVFQRGIMHAGTIVGTWRRGGRPGRRALDVVGFDTLPADVAHDAERLHAQFPYLGA